jgi:long-chain acyl-CoA synthetase
MLDRPWLESHPKGIHCDADLTPAAVDQILDDAVAKRPLLPAVSFVGRTLACREHAALVDRATTGLQKLGVESGIHVGLYL